MADARRRIPMTPRVAAILDMRLSKSAGGRWVFPAATKSGHVEPSSLKKQHLNAIADATRILKKHTVSEEASLKDSSSTGFAIPCLTRWAPHMDPWTLGYLAGHRDMNISAMFIRRSRQFAAIRSGTSGKELIRKSGKLLKQRKFLARPERLELPTYCSKPATHVESVT